MDHMHISLCKSNTEKAFWNISILKKKQRRLSELIKNKIYCNWLYVKECKKLLTS